MVLGGFRDLGITKSEMLWRPQDVGVARVMEYLHREAANGGWHQCSRKKGVAVSKVEVSCRSKECFDTRHGDAVFEVYPAGFWPYCCPVFLYYDIAASPAPYLTACLYVPP